MTTRAAAILGVAIVAASIIIAFALIHHGASAPCTTSDPFGRACK